MCRVPINHTPAYKSKYITKVRHKIINAPHRQHELTFCVRFECEIDFICIHKYDLFKYMHVHTNILISFNGIIDKVICLSNMFLLGENKTEVTSAF